MYGPPQRTASTWPRLPAKIRCSAPSSSSSSCCLSLSSPTPRPSNAGPATSQRSEACQKLRPTATQPPPLPPSNQSCDRNLFYTRKLKSLKKKKPARLHKWCGACSLKEAAKNAAGNHLACLFLLGYKRELHQPQRTNLWCKIWL